jgi:transcription-repair coupling factor (superfamily II helicase)
LRSSPERQILFLVPREDEARRLYQDVEFFCVQNQQPATAVAWLPAHDNHPYADVSTDQSMLAARLAVLFRLTQSALAPRIVVASAPALHRRVLPPEELRELSTLIRKATDIDREETMRKLLAAGYLRAPLVTDAGTFSVRGGVIDLFPSLSAYPVRIDLYGDTVESIRSFDPDTQRTLRDIDEVWIHPVRETVATRGSDPVARIRAAADATHHPSKETRRILDHVKNFEELVRGQGQPGAGVSPAHGIGA